MKKDKLYESIMNKVSKVVRESLSDNDNKKYDRETLIKIEKALDEAQIWYEYVQNSSISVKLIEILVEGDWKHDHMYADQILNRLGFTKINEELCEDSDSDSYSSIHRYTDDEYTLSIAKLFQVNESLSFDDVKKYEIDMTFYVDYDSNIHVPHFVDKLNNTKYIYDCDWEDDGEGYNVNCIFRIPLDIKKPTFNDIDKAFTKYLNDYNLDIASWDYHYIKGLNDDFYWQP